MEVHVGEEPPKRRQRTSLTFWHGLVIGLCVYAATAMGIFAYLINQNAQRITEQKQQNIATRHLAIAAQVIACRRSAATRRQQGVLASNQKFILRSTEGILANSPFAQAKPALARIYIAGYRAKAKELQQLHIPNCDELRVALQHGLPRVFKPLDPPGGGR